MATFRSFAPWGRKVAEPEVHYPLAIEADPPLGDGTDYLMQLEPFDAIDPNWGWNKLLESLVITIDSITLSSGSLDDNQLPEEQTYEHSDFGDPYTPVAGDDWTITGGPPAFDVEQNATASPQGSSRIYCGRLTLDLGGGVFVDVLFYFRVERSYAILPWYVQSPEDGMFYSQSTVQYKMYCWLEADLSELEIEGSTRLPVPGVSYPEGDSPVHQLGFIPTSIDECIIYKEARSYGGSSEPLFGTIDMPEDVPEIKLYEYPISLISEADMSVTMGGCEFGLQRWGSRGSI